MEEQPSLVLPAGLPYLKAVKRILSEYRRIDSANEELARRLHAKSGKTVSCRPGCSGCCSQFVATWYLEALIAISEARRVGFEIDRKTVEAQTYGFLKDKEMTREKLFGKHLRCVFLGHAHSCAIYPARPIACRAVWSVSNPSECSSATGSVERIDNRPIIQQAYRLMMAEHKMSTLMGVVSHLPVMLDLVMKGGLPSDLAKKEGVFGLEDKRIVD